MNQYFAPLLLALASAGMTPIASATVLNFDDLGGEGAVPANYGGLDWSGNSWFAYASVQEPFTAHSGDYRVASGFGDADAATAIRFGTPSTFQGAWFAGLEGATVTLQLYLGGALVATSATLDPNAMPVFLASGYAGLVDQVIVSSPAQGAYVMDDFTFAQAVPEPQTWALMFAGLGLVGLVGASARRRSNPHRG